MNVILGLSSKVREKEKRLNTMKLMSRFIIGLGNEGAPLYMIWLMMFDVNRPIGASKNYISHERFNGWHDLSKS